MKWLKTFISNRIRKIGPFISQSAVCELAVFVELFDVNSTHPLHISSSLCYLFAVCAAQFSLLFPSVSLAHCSVKTYMELYPMSKCPSGRINRVYLTSSHSGETSQTAAGHVGGLLT